MKDTFVSYETAKLLKEIGFPQNLDFVENQFFYYDNPNYAPGSNLPYHLEDDSNENYILYRKDFTWQNESDYYSYEAPPQSLAHKFITNKTNHFIYINRYKFNNKYAYSFNILNEHNKLIMWSGWTDVVYASYEEAFEAGLQEILKHLKDEKISRHG